MHRAAVVYNWFSQHPDIQVIRWPAKSPDLNPIENLWGLMVQRWDMRNERTTEALEAHCLGVWESTRGTDICTYLIESIKCLLSVVENSGGNTKY